MHRIFYALTAAAVFALTLLAAAGGPDTFYRT